MLPPSKCTFYLYAYIHPQRISESPSPDSRTGAVLGAGDKLYDFYLRSSFGESRKVEAPKKAISFAAPPPTSLIS